MAGHALASNANGASDFLLIRLWLVSQADASNCFEARTWLIYPDTSQRGALATLGPAADNFLSTIPSSEKASAAENVFLKCWKSSFSCSVQKTKLQFASEASRKLPNDCSTPLVSLNASTVSLENECCGQTCNGTKFARPTGHGLWRTRGRCTQTFWSSPASHTADCPLVSHQLSNTRHCHCRRAFLQA